MQYSISHIVSLFVPLCVTCVTIILCKRSRRRNAIHLYCSNIYGFTTKKLLSRLRVAINRAVRYVYFSSSDPLNTTKILGTNSLDNYIKAHTCVFLYKIRITKTPRYLHNLLSTSARPRLEKLVPTYFSTVEGRRDFFAFVPRLWNELDTHTRSIERVNLFRQSCLQHNFKN